MVAISQALVSTSHGSTFAAVGIAEVDAVLGDLMHLAVACSIPIDFSCPLHLYEALQQAHHRRK